MSVIEIDSWDPDKPVRSCKLIGGTYDGRLVQVDTRRDHIKLTPPWEETEISAEGPSSEDTIELLLYVKLVYIVNRHEKVAYVWNKVKKRY